MRLAIALFLSASAFGQNESLAPTVKLNTSETLGLRDAAITAEAQQIVVRKSMDALIDRIKHLPEYEKLLKDSGVMDKDMGNLYRITDGAIQRNQATGRMCFDMQSGFQPATSSGCPQYIPLVRQFEAQFGGGR